MKQTVDKAPKKPGSTWSDVIMHHSAIQPLLDHDLPRTVDESVGSRGHDFSQLPLNSTHSSSQHTNAVQSCPFTPQRCPFGGACHACPPRVQAKLTINQPGDEYEQEADRVADQVMRTPDRTNRAIHSINGPAVQKEETKTSAPESEKDKLVNPKLLLQLPQPDFFKLRTPFFERNAYSLWDSASALNVWKYNFDFFKRLGFKDDLAGKASNLTAPFAIDAQLKANHPKWWEITDTELKTTSYTLSIPLFDFSADFRAWKPLPFLQKKAGEASSQPCVSPRFVPGHAVPSFGTGRPLDPDTRNYFEPRFGLDFGRVRVYAGPEAAESASAINARAYTLGNNVVFGTGEYQPGTMQGKRLIAHELTHVVQQGGALPNEGLISVSSAVPGTVQLEPAPRPANESVWGLNVTRSMCACRQRVRDGISWANTAGAAYAACDVPANATATDVEACFDAAQPGTTTVGTTSSSGAITLPAPSADPCERIDNKATFVHETMHARHADAMARARGTAFFREWRRLAGDPNRLDTMRATFPAQVAAFEAQWQNGHDWAQDEVNSYKWERRFLVDTLAALNRIC